MPGSRTMDELRRGRSKASSLVFVGDVGWVGGTEDALGCMRACWAGKMGEWWAGGREENWCCSAISACEGLVWRAAMGDIG